MLIIPTGIFYCSTGVVTCWFWAGSRSVSQLLLCVASPGVALTGSFSVLGLLITTSGTATKGWSSLQILDVSISLSVDTVSLAY